MMFEYPANKKLRPVVQHGVIVYRKRKEVTFSNSAISERLFCSGVSV